MIYIDETIRLAVSNLKQLCVTNDAAGERLGISGKHVSQIIKGEVESIRPSTWETMEPILKPYIHRKKPDVVEESTIPYKTKNDRLHRLCHWMEYEACPDQKEAVYSTAKAVGFPTAEEQNNLRFGQSESRSAAGVA